ncbi:potassium channel family protein [Demequina silvatica]|uniref:potassium channel family protein n=1 Tax=Demequina silvatica TaxID=1638988 RepID=UPI003F700057
MDRRADRLAAPARRLRRALSRPERRGEPQQAPPRRGLGGPSLLRARDARPRARRLPGAVRRAAAARPGDPGPGGRRGVLHHGARHGRRPGPRDGPLPGGVQVKVMIAGAGSVGRSIARDLLEHGHEVLLVDSNPAAMRVAQVAEAEWMLADVCEMSALRDAQVETMDVVVAATGDDKANLVVSFLAKTEFGVPRTVARVNNPRNEWMYDAQWGVDVAVSTPRIMTAMVEEAVAIGDLVRVFTFRQSGAALVEVTLPASSPVVGVLLREIQWPVDIVLATIIRGDRTIAPTPDDTLEAHDELLFIVSSEADPESLEQLLRRGPAAIRPTA